MPPATFRAGVGAPLGLRAAGPVLVLDRGERQLRGDLVAIAKLEALCHVRVIMAVASDIWLLRRFGPVPVGKEFLFHRVLRIYQGCIGPLILGG